MKRGYPSAGIAAVAAMTAMLAGAASAQTSSITTISSSPVGAQFSVDGQNYEQPTSAAWPQGSKHLLSALPSQLRAGSGTLMVFTNWAWAGGSFTQPDLTITADPAITYYTAKFDLQYQLSVIFYACGSPNAPTPGTVYVNGTAYSCNSQTFIEAGSTVAVQAIPNDGWVFTGWATATNQSILGFQSTVTMNEPMSIYPEFAPARNINISTLPQGLTVLADRAPIAAPYTLQWGFGTVHTLAAITPQMDIRGNPWVFSAWSDGGAAMHAYTVAPVSMPDTVTANYIAGVGATFTTEPGGLKLTVDGVSTVPPYNFIWSVGEAHSFSAPARQTDSSGHVWDFAGWSNGGPAAQSITIPSSAVGQGIRYTATFTPAGHLTVNSTISSAAITINGQACAVPCDVTQPVGTSIDIGASTSLPNGSNSRLDLSGWTGTATGGPGDLVVTLGPDPIAVFANYRQMNYLGMSSNPKGSVNWMVEPASPDGFYSATATVNVSVTPLPGFKFRSWSGDLSSTSPTAAVAMTAPRAVMAILDTVPYVAPAGVENGAGSTPVASVAPGSVVSVFGANLSAATAIGAANPLPQTLGGVTATIGQQLAPLFFTSPGQINFQLPEGVALDGQTLTIASQGQPNVQVNFNVARNAPGLFQQSIGGQPFGLAYHADGSAVTAAAPAQVGETIAIYGTGFGPTNPARLEGYALPASPVYNIVDSVTVSAGSVTVPAEAAFALAGGVGIDVAQFAITDPLASGSNVLVSVTINGQSSNTVLVPVQ
jgi:uncharacterized protein (TIGR03437 family)